MQNWGEQTERRNREEVRRLRSLLMLFFAFQTGSDFSSDSELQTLAVRQDMCWMSGRNIISIRLLTSIHQSPENLRRAHEGCSWDAWATTPMSIATTFSRFGVSITQHFKNRRSPLHLHPSSLLPFSAIYLPPVPFVPLDPPVELLASWVTKRVASRARLATTCRWTLGLATSKERAETLDKLAARKPIRMGSNLKKHHGFWDFPPHLGSI